MTHTSPADHATRDARSGRRTLATVGGAAVIAVVIGTWVGGTGSADAGAIADVLPAPLLPGLRLVVDGAGIAAVGVALLLVLLAGVDDIEPRMAAHVRGVAVAAGTAWWSAALVALWLQAADAAGLNPFRIDTPTVMVYLESIDAARGLLTSAAAGAVFVGLALGGHRSVLVRWPEAAGLVAMAGLLAGPVTGHAGTHDDGGFALVLIVVHVAASAAWVGGLGAMVAVLVRRRDLLAAVLPRFSAMAGACIAAVTVSGAAAALIQVSALADLLDTGYGRLVLVKVACLAGLGALGWWARRELSRRTAATAAGGAMSMGRLLVVEVTLMAVTIGVAAALAGTSPTV